MTKRVLRPQPGPQTQFAETRANIAIYGGAAGGGKSYALLLEPTRHAENPRFGCVIFRRVTTQVRNEGGLWDESYAMYKPMDWHPHEGMLEWKAPSGMRVKFAHLQHEKTKFDWQGSQIPLIGFDELTHFTETQFVYMMSRNRSTSGVQGYIRATCNPDVDSWVRKWIDWYIKGDDYPEAERGYPIPERSGKIRWFVRQGDEMIWGNTREGLVEQYGEETMPKSFTFIPSKLSDNVILMNLDPNYKASLLAMPRVERERLLGGNWNVRASSGDYFKRSDFEVIDVLPGDVVQTVRYWDRASTKPNDENKDPDWTRGIKMSKHKDGTFVVQHMASIRDNPAAVKKLLKSTASQDSRSVIIYLEQEPGSSGESEVQDLIQLLSGYATYADRPTGDKITRAHPVSAYSESGKIKVMRGAWNADFFTELENFPPPKNKGHDDQVDTLSGAFNKLTGSLSILNVL
jgi:predicted phage terminase large subunit-like protein